MQNKKTIVIPALVAVFALMFVAATPLIVAEPSEGDAKHSEKMDKSPKEVQIDGFVGSIQITEESDKATLREQITVSLSEAADGLDVTKARLGVAVNENGDRYLVWKLVKIDKEPESETATITIFVVDAANAENTASITEDRDFSMKSKRYGN